MRRPTASNMSNSFVAVVVTVPEDQFPDEDDICITASRFVCAHLESHLVQNGHSIPDWIAGGCDEDWGVYFQSQHKETTFEYHIGFFPSPPGTLQNQIIIQYHVRLPLIKQLFRNHFDLVPEHPMHDTMRSFASRFSTSRMLTQCQFESEY